MKKLALLATGFVMGVAAFACIEYNNIERDGEVVHDDDEMYVKAAKNRNCGYAEARVYFKNPQ